MSIPLNSNSAFYSIAVLLCVPLNLKHVIPLRAFNKEYLIALKTSHARLSSFFLVVLIPPLCISFNLEHIVPPRAYHLTYSISPHLEHLIPSRTFHPTQGISSRQEHLMCHSADFKSAFYCILKLFI